MSAPLNVQDLLDGHVRLQLESVDRLYLNGYVPELQHGAGLVRFLSEHRAQPIASPALLGQISGKFVAEVKAFAQRDDIPLFHFGRKESKDRRAQQLRAERGVRDAVVFIGIAQEKAYAFSARRLPGKRAFLSLRATNQLFLTTTTFISMMLSGGSRLLKCAATRLGALSSTLMGTSGSNAN
jgi:hypothetical protein